ncbi:hypothetical protein DLAC_05446 [Tieghemostelium lacteum]|uniref:Uncharacterized protein n=1 Tax=Tieghemostelium lacteum TaxID=361077 RepID=A0A151ZFW3_TIELA|nr:hypothetical protein DLAC_05446 [Tieghemostelium lacteum]|eukprot:KYQ92858.1 hypothetical protein DLAC_05446 [Tieghemostelium lacteum]
MNDIHDTRDNAIQLNSKETLVHNSSKKDEYNLKKDNNIKNIDNITIERDTISTSLNTENQLNLEEENDSYSSKIKENKKNLNDLNAKKNKENKTLSENRNNFNKKNYKIINEVFKDISSEVDEPVLEFLIKNQDKPINEDIEQYNITSNHNNNRNNEIIEKENCTFSPLQSSSKLYKDSIPPLQLESQEPINNNKNNNNRISPKNERMYYPYPCLDNLTVNSVIYYYQLIAQYFLNNPDQVEVFRPVLYSLWTHNQWFYLIYSSMFYQWLLQYRLSFIPQLNIFIKASNRLFWYDTDHQTRKYYDVYQKVKQRLLDRSLWKGLYESIEELQKSQQPSPDQIQSALIRNRRIWVDFFHIISIFYFYYEKSMDMINEFRQVLNQQYEEYILDSPLVQQKGSVLSIDDIFVRGIIRHLSLIKHEETLIRYMERCTIFSSWNINPTTKVKLQSCLYSFTRPGGPTYPPRPVRVKSREVLGRLFPKGRFSRLLVNLFFRLLHPFYTVNSIFDWFFTDIPNTIKYHYNKVLNYLNFFRNVKKDKDKNKLE